MARKLFTCSGGGGGSKSNFVDFTAEASGRRQNSRSLPYNDGDGDTDSVVSFSIKNCLCSTLCLTLELLIYTKLLILALCALAYFLPIGHPEPHINLQPARPRPKFEAELASNEQLQDNSQRLFLGQFHGPESMAWLNDGSGEFYTGVEGGFVLRVRATDTSTPARFQVVGRLNAADEPALDISHLIDNKLSPSDDDDDDATSTKLDISVNLPIAAQLAKLGHAPVHAPLCNKDVDVYGPEAASEPSRVRVSRCSRPLGIRLAPSAAYLYAVDSMAGIFKLERNSATPNRSLGQASGAAEPSERLSAVRLLDLATGNDQSATVDEPQRRVLFADDLAVDWAASTKRRGADVLYLTDCSLRYGARHLLRILLEFDSSGRLLVLDTGDMSLRQLQAVTPVVYLPHLFERQKYARSAWALGAAGARRPLRGAELLDSRPLAFPNGLELTANKSALLVSDLANRRLLMHHIKGPLSGMTAHLLWLPGYPDNVRRGADLPDGTPTYWLAFGCAVADGSFEIAEATGGGLGWLRVVLVKSLHFIGSLLEAVGGLAGSADLLDAGLCVRSQWLAADPFCASSLVLRVTETAQILSAPQTHKFSSNFKLLSEASQFERRANGSLLFLGSVYYNYLGRLELLDSN